MAFLFCNIAWMTSYQGQYNKSGEIIDQPARGGKYVDTNGEAHESCNFFAADNDLVYGHVETWKGGVTGYDTSIKIDNLSASKNDAYIDGIDVIWIATHKNGGKRVIGWYKGARVYRDRQHLESGFATEQHERDNIGSYRIVCNKKNAHLINENERNLKLDKNNIRTGWPGQNSVFYPSEYQSNIELNILVGKLTSLLNSEIVNDEDDNETAFFEGNETFVLHKKKERSQGLIKAFKAQLLDFSCSICDFSFEEAYGSLGKEYIEAHHKVPMSKLTEETEVTISDLAAVCSNCHRMLHHSSEITDISQLKNLIDN